jgi:hypothetical protein
VTHEPDPHARPGRRRPPVSSAPSLTRVRDVTGFGGLVPTAAVARAGDTLVAALCVEHHADGALLPLLVLSGAPGALGWDPVAGLRVADDAGRRYEVRPLAQQAGLGALLSSVWITPGPPPEARGLRLEVTGLSRTSAARGGPATPRPLVGETWELDIPLYPARTAAEPPPPPPATRPAGRPAHVPARAFGAFRDLVPVGQARMTEGAAVCLWALERYRDRAVLTVAALVEEHARVGPIAAGHGSVTAWDDLGTRYAVAPVHGAARPGWSETSLEIVPAVPDAARSIGVRIADMPEEPAPGGRIALTGPFTFGIALPPAP